MADSGESIYCKSILSRSSNGFKSDDVDPEHQTCVRASRDGAYISNLNAIDCESSTRGRDTIPWRSHLCDGDAKTTNAVGDTGSPLVDERSDAAATCALEERDESVDRRTKIMTFIEDIMLNIVEAEQDGKSPTIVFRNHNDWENCNFDEGVSLKPTGEAFTREVKFCNSRSKSRFALIVRLLSRIYRLLQTNTTCTKRELYYQNVSIVKSQSTLDSVIRDVSCLLEVPAHELGILATSKGLVAGSLTLTTSDDRTIDCVRGALVPQDVMGIRTITSTATFILVVEKDAIFQKLLDEEMSTRLGPCILVTGKGFPDVNTRLLLKRLWTELSVPILALADADPHGIEIMFVYRFGSLGMSHQADSLIVPSLRWIGVHPSDIVLLNVPRLTLNAEDRSKLSDLMRRPYLRTHPLIEEQLLVLHDTDAKAEIEAVASLSNAYLTDVYLPNKIRSRDLI